MKRLSLIFLFCALLFGKHLTAQTNSTTDYPFLYQVTLGANVSYDANSGFYYYNFILANDRNNRGGIFMFEIDIMRHPGSVAYDTTGLKFATDYEEGQLRRYYASTADAVESIGFSSLPSLNWSVDIAHNSVASFGVDTLSPEPGTTVTGFTMMSKALPGIRALAVYPDFNEDELFPVLDEDTTSPVTYVATVAKMDSIQSAVNYHGWTIGPTAPPLNFSATSWIDTLISYKHQCLVQGWLTDNKSCKQDCDDIMNGRDWYMQGNFEQYDKWYPDNSWGFDRDWHNGIVEVLDARLNKAKAELSRKDSVSARKDLEIFVMEVEC